MIYPQNYLDVKAVNLKNCFAFKDFEKSYLEFKKNKAYYGNQPRKAYERLLDAFHLTAATSIGSALGFSSGQLFRA